MDPFMRFLGVPDSAGAEALLGLREESPSRVAVEMALQHRLDQVYRHPAGNTAGAERVRKRLRDAAAELIGRGLGAARSGLGVPAKTAAAGPETVRIEPLASLTEFDRQVLAVLVGYGGWNARSRARLVALAESRQVTPPGLIRVIRGLNDYARAGGPHLNVAQMAFGGRAQTALGAAALDAVPSLADRLTPELRGGDAWSIFKLSMLFGLLTLLVGLVVIRTLVTDVDGDGAPTPPPVVSDGRAGGTGQGEAVEAPAGGLGPATFRQRPTFRGNALPRSATEAADACGTLPEYLELTARKLAVTDDPAEQVFRDWAISIETMARGWVLVDTSTRRAIEHAVEDVMYEAADAPSIGDRLLEAMHPPRGRLDEPVDVWRGAWKAGTLGRLGGSDTVPPTVAAGAQRALAVTTDRREVEGLLTFTDGSDAWLARAADWLVDVTEFNEDIYDHWEMWLAAQRRLGGAERFNAAMMAVIERFLRSPVDLSYAGPSVNVLGRLLLETDFQSSPVVRDRTLALFEGDDAASDHALWVLTSLLSQLDTASWFDAKLVMARERGRQFRSRMRDRIAAAWPAMPEASEGKRSARGQGIIVDARVGLRWREMYNEVVTATRVSGDVGRMWLLVSSARLNESAALLAAGRVEEARSALEAIERMPALAAGRPAITAGGGARGAWSVPQPAGGISVLPRQRAATGRASTWAARYAEAGKNIDAKLELLDELRDHAADDLEPADAEVFVTEVYRGSDPDVRSAARAVLLDRFARGRSVAIELVNQFPNRVRTEALSETLSALTGRLLPPVRNESWELEARLALARHALVLREDQLARVDPLAAALGESYAVRVSAVGRVTVIGSTADAPQEIAGLLVESWRQRSTAAITADPTPADLLTLAKRQETRRRLAEGPIQRFVADLISVAELHAYVTVAEQPQLRNHVLTVLADCARRRGAARHVLDQAIEVERCIAELWRWRLWIPGEDDHTVEVVQ